MTAPGLAPFGIRLGHRDGCDQVAAGELVRVALDRVPRQPDLGEHIPAWHGTGVRFSQASGFCADSVVFHAQVWSVLGSNIDS
jgi:hypothetical protein